MSQVRAIRMFPAERDGQTVVVLAGARYPSTHPIVKAHPAMFEPVPAKGAKKRR